MTEKALIITPTFNELDNITKLIPQLLSKHESIEVLVVDDNSPDGTGNYVEELSKTNSRVHVLHRPQKMGLGTAYIAGFKYALQHDYDYIFEMDADFSHDPKEIPNFLNAIKTHDLVLGSR